MRRLLAVAVIACSAEQELLGGYFGHPISGGFYPLPRVYEQTHGGLVEEPIAYEVETPLLDDRLRASVITNEGRLGNIEVGATGELILPELIAEREPILYERPVVEIDGSIGIGETISVGETRLPHSYAHGHPLYDYKQYPTWNKSRKFADYYCPREGYSLTYDGDCCREAHCESRLECPYEFTFNGHGCYKFYEPTVYCPRGTLIHGRCRIVKSEDAVYECPEGTTLDGDGNCFLVEEYTPIEVCPPSTIRSKNGCLAVEYTEPTLVCPPDTIPEGKKCRREIVTLKMKKGRRLSATEETDELAGEAVEYEEYDLTAEELEAMGQGPAFAFEDLYADIAVSPVPDCDNGLDCYGEWLPATSEFKIKTKKVKQPIVSEQLKWEKVKIPVTAAKVRDVKVKVPEVKVKLPKEKLSKVPHEVVKVVTQAAEKVCPIGVKHGATCVAESIVPPILECPHPQLGAECARKLIVPPIAMCLEGELICDHFGCRCDTFEEFKPEVTCAGKHQLINGHCVVYADWQRMCPIGFFLDKDGVTCSKTDCEPALTVVAKPLTVKKKLPKKFMEAEDDEFSYQA